MDSDRITLTDSKQEREKSLDLLFQLFVRYQEDRLEHAKVRLGVSESARQAIELLRSTTYPNTREDFEAYLGEMTLEHRDSFLARLSRGFNPVETVTIPIQVSVGKENNVVTEDYQASDWRHLVTEKARAVEQMLKK
jgi:hypothetical protein